MPRYHRIGRVRLRRVYIGGKNADSEWQKGLADDMTEIPWRDIQRNVAKALLELWSPDFKRRADEKDISALKRLSGIPEGHIMTCLRTWQVPVAQHIGFISVPYSDEVRAMLEANLAMPVRGIPDALGGPTFNISNSNVQAAGRDVTGTMNINMTSEQVIQRLREEIEAANASREEKESALAVVDKFARHPLLTALFGKILELGFGWFRSGQ